MVKVENWFNIYYMEDQLDFTLEMEVVNICYLRDVVLKIERDLPNSI